MVFISRLAIATTLAALSNLALADLKVTNPSATSWWVAKSQNVLSWDCSNTQPSSFTVLIANKDPTVLAAPLAIIAIQNNFDCSKEITQNQAAQPAGTGYRILLANPVNNTDVYVSSDEFEIKPLGSAYPSSSSVSATGSGAGGSGTAAGANTPSSTNKPSDASITKSTLGFALAAFGTAVGLLV